MQKMLEKRLAATTEEADREFLQDYFGQMTSSWQAGIPTEEAKFYSDLLYQEFVTILDYFPSNSLLVVDDYQRIMETNREIEREAAEWHTQKISELRVFSEQSFSADVQRIVQKEKFTTTFFSLFQKGWEIFVSKQSIISISDDATVLRTNAIAENRNGSLAQAKTDCCDLYSDKGKNT